MTGIWKISCVLLSFVVAGRCMGSITEPSWEALQGERHRVVIASDIGGGDEDDILKLIDIYAEDYPNLLSHGDTYPSPQYLRSITVQGAISPAPNSGFSGGIYVPSNRIGAVAVNKWREDYLRHWRQRMDRYKQAGESLMEGTASD